MADPDLIELLNLISALRRDVKDLADYARKATIVEIQNPATSNQRRDLLSERLVIDSREKQDEH